MSGFLCSELRRAFVSPWFVAGFLVCFAGLIFSGSSELDFTNPQGDALTAFYFAYQANNALWFFVVGAALPYAGSLCEDLGRGLFSLEKGRISLRKFVVGRVLACGVSGGAALCLAIACFGVLCIFGNEVVVSTESGHVASAGGFLPYMSLAADGCVLEYAVFFGVAQFFFGAFWACFGLAVSVFFPRVYVAFAAPLVAALVFVQLGRLGGLPDLINPCYLSTDAVVGSPLETASVVNGMYVFAIAGLGVVLFLGLRRRWRCG